MVSSLVASIVSLITAIFSTASSGIGAGTSIFKLSETKKRTFDERKTAYTNSKTNKNESKKNYMTTALAVVVVIILLSMLAK